MTALLERLPAYKKIILTAIEAATTREDILVCSDLINLFSDRFKDQAEKEEFQKHWFELHDAIVDRRAKITTP